MDTLFDREQRHAEAPERHGAARPAKPAFGLRWIPVRTLAPRHRPRLLKHLLALDDRDRYLRFGYAASDAQIERYVEHINFERDEVFGVFDRRLALVAVAHLAYLEGHASGRPCAEFGVSVAKASRGRGYGERLFDHAALHARNRGVDTLLVHALSENTAMLRIAHNAGASIVRDGPESEARVQLAPENLASHMEELVEGHAADLDYRLKLQVNRVDELLCASGRD